MRPDIANVLGPTTEVTLERVRSRLLLPEPSLLGKMATLLRTLSRDGKRSGPEREHQMAGERNDQSLDQPSPKSAERQRKLHLKDQDSGSERLSQHKSDNQNIGDNDDDKSANRSKSQDKQAKQNDQKDHAVKDLDPLGRVEVTDLHRQVQNQQTLGQSAVGDAETGRRELRHLLSNGSSSRMNGVLHRTPPVSPTRAREQPRREQSLAHFVARQSTPAPNGSSDAPSNGALNAAAKGSALGTPIVSVSPALGPTVPLNVLHSPPSFGTSTNVSRSSLVPEIPVKETRHVSLEYDPITRRKVLNTYEILREIGRGEHGKVKLARDLVHDELVAIKIVSRKNKHERPRLRLRPTDTAVFDAEAKVRREIAIMKRCHHKNIVRLREVLDDRSMYKIYLVLEYMDRGELRWKRRTPVLSPQPRAPPDAPIDIRIPCGAARASEDSDLLSSEYSPSLTFRQARRIFRDVVLGLEYLHMQGIVHRDIKPANLLVAHDYLVKISDFGVSFASFLSSADDGVRVSEMDLAKTVGTPAFFAPELCQTNFAQPEAVPHVTHKIDIWALGVTLYCLLFGRVPFNADSEFQLFDVIVNQPVQFPSSADGFHSPQEVTDVEFDLAQDLLRNMLCKDSNARYDILQIKCHPFVLIDLENDLDGINEFFFLNSPDLGATAFGSADQELDPNDLDSAVVGVGARIRSSLMRSMRSLDPDALRRLSTKLELSLSGASSSDDSSHLGSHNNSCAQLHSDKSDLSVILSEAQQVSSPMPSRLHLETKARTNSAPPLHLPLYSNLGHTTHFPTNSSLATINLSIGQSNMNIPLAQPTMSSPLAQPVTTSSPLAQPTMSSHSSQPTMSSPLVQATLSSTIAQPTGNSSLNQLNQLNQLNISQTPHKLSISSGRSNLILLEVLEIASPTASRKGSSAGIMEAPQIETKRNVVGDVYLKNQSAIDAFKDIQQLDQKRRKSSAYAILASNNSALGSSNPPTPRTLGSSPMATTMDHSTLSKIKVGPISINNSRRPSSVISLPMTESFASLDSFNDTYLTHKYEELRKKKLTHDATVPASNDGFKQRPNDKFDQINEKFSNFNLGSLMTARHGSRDASAEEHIAPTSTTFDFGNSNDDASESLSSSLSSSCSSGSSSESDGEEGNLTLKFTSKVAPRTRAPFLTMDSRAFSHDSNLKRLVHQPPSSNYYPVIFNTNSLDVEDVPVGLMSGSPSPTSSRFEATDMTPTASALTSTLSSATITQETGKQKLSIKPPMKSSGLRKEIFPSSPLDLLPTDNQDGPKSAIATKFAPKSEMSSATIHNGYYSNHYRKEPQQMEFPQSKHLDNDRESNHKQVQKQKLLLRPSFNRSNSIAIGLLQHQRSLKDVQ